MMALTCRECRYFSGAPGALERAVPGVNILSSAYGSVRADTAICEHRGVFITPAPACPDFLHKPRADCSAPDAPAQVADQPSYPGPGVKFTAPRA